MQPEAAISTRPDHFWGPLGPPTKAGKILGLWKGFCTKTKHESTTQKHMKNIPYTAGRIMGGGRSQWFGGGHHGECGARAYNGGPGAEPLVRVAKPPLKLKAFKFGYWMSNGAGKFSPFLKMSFRTSLHATKSLTTAESSMQSKRSLCTCRVIIEFKCSVGRHGWPKVG